MFLISILVVLQTLFADHLVLFFSDAVGCAAFIAIDDNPVSHKNWDSLFHVESRLDFRRSLGSACLGG